METEPIMAPQNDDVVRWEGLNVELLALIFLRISPSADEIIKSVCLVCKWWLKVVGGPYCWADIDIQDWARRISQGVDGYYEGPDRIEDVVKKLVSRSKCTAKSFAGYRVQYDGFARVASCGRFLTVLKIPKSDISDDMVKKHVKELVNLKELDISYCMGITHRGISYFGRSCPSLTNLRRNLVDSFSHKIVREDYDGSEANAIAKTMGGLCHLEIVFGHFGDRGLNKILTNCKSLTHLDIHGCGMVCLKGDLKERCEQLSFFNPPYVFISDSEESSGSECENIWSSLLRGVIGSN